MDKPNGEVITLPTLYEGTKRLYAEPMTRGEYSTYRGWELPTNENPDDAGYIVEYVDGGKPNLYGHPGYVSWSPKDVFEKTYREVGNEVANQARAGGAMSPYDDPAWRERDNLHTALNHAVHSAVQSGMGADPDNIVGAAETFYHFLAGNNAAVRANVT